MAFLNRILASLINILLFIFVILITYPAYKQYEIEFDDKTFYLIIFTITYFFPILCLKSTVGLKILKIEVNSATKLFLKYFIYYLIISKFLEGYFGILSELFNINEFEITIISIELTLLLIHLMMFALSGGKYNLLDFVLNIIHASKNYRRTNEKRLIIWLSFCFLISFTVILADKFAIIPYLKSLISLNSKYSIPSYYPSDVFENYGIIRSEKFEESNRILIYSDSTSIVQDKILARKTIYATINKEVCENNIKRKELCKNLIYYSSINDYVGDIYGDIDQTKIVLVYFKRNTFFSALTWTYLYFYDNKNPIGDTYGGINLDSLIKSYNSYPETLIKTISKILNLDEEDLKERRTKDDQIVYSNNEISIINSASNDKFPFPFNLRFIPFDSIKPTKNLITAFPSRSVTLDLFELNPTSTIRTNEALDLRNKIYYKYFYRPGR